MIYLDYNASTPIDPAVAQAMLPYLSSNFANPSASHALGQDAAAVIARSKAQVAELIGCSAGEIVFTSGASESNNLALQGVAHARGPAKHIITTAVEHQSVLAPCRLLQQLGHRVTVLPVDAHGQVSAAAVANALTDDTILVSVMHANNEVGTVQPVQQIAALLRQHPALLHTDAALSAGKIPTQVDDLGVDLMTLAGHKMYAPKGIGALYVRAGTPLAPHIYGIGQQGGLRAGTENVLLAVAYGVACERALALQSSTSTHLASLRDALQAGLRSLGERLRINGHPHERLPNTLNVSFAQASGRDVLAGAQRIAASPGGTSCNKGTLSHVLTAMGLDPMWGRGAVRFSVGRFSTLDEVQEAAALLVAAYQALV